MTGAPLYKLIVKIITVLFLVVIVKCNVQQINLTYTEAGKLSEKPVQERRTRSVATCNCGQDYYPVVSKCETEFQHRVNWFELPSSRQQELWEDQVQMNLNFHGAVPFSPSLLMDLIQVMLFE